ncbi:unnamed protein product [Anisakis simplex]|uniref:DNA replication complex GINS protein PSF3 n=1 Tax=Anisakis simplex TaxID=6269 RepID=A0A0M3JYK1_ANISI|nr:unnamed protein product [Anisakis simplex]
MEKIQEVDQNYYDLDDIIASTSNIQMSFNRHTSKEIFPLLGYKAPETISERTFKVELPLFMAQPLRQRYPVFP